jgi:uncharacterized protein YukE
MANGYSYNPAGGLDTGADLRALTRDLESSLSNLEQAAARFLAANEGESIANYDVAQRNWSAGQTEMNHSMGKGIVALDEIHLEYIRGDKAGANQFAGG